MPNQMQNQMLDDPYGKFAQERSHNDAKMIVEYGKSLIQAVIGINGVAVTALITLSAAAKETAAALAHRFALALVLYGLGVACGGVASLFMYLSCQRWADKWKESALGNEGSKKDIEDMKWGKSHQKLSIYFNLAGLLIFVVASLAAG
jgi:ABC-type transport system involved in multi-copper enzyme maturation permease subunit